MTLQSNRRRFLQSAAASAALGSAGLAATATTLAAAQTLVPRKPLGSTGELVPIMQLGTSQSLDPVYDKVMHRCFAAGVTMFDTALSYGWGSSHRAIANFIDQIGDRGKLWLTSKSGSGSVKGLTQGLDQALEELHTDYLDLYLMHGINNAAMLEPEFLALGDTLRRSGKTRFFGFSCHSGNVVELMNKAAEVGGIDAILFRYNFRRYGERELNLAIDRCKQAGIGLMAMKTMGSVPAEIEQVVQFQSDSFSLPQAKLKSVWADERIDTLLSEMDSVGVARENIAAATSTQTLNALEAHQLNRLAAMTSGYACNGCSHHCETATGKTVAIADSLRYLMYYECYGKKQRAQELYRALPERARCGPQHQQSLAAATAACPQGIDIASRLQRARDLLDA